MKIELIDGKRYIEFNKVLIVVVTAIVALLGAMIYLIYFVVDNYDTIYSDPLNYGAKVYDVNQCSCTTNKNLNFNFNKTTIWSIQEYRNSDGSRMEFPKLNLSKVNNGAS